MNQHRTLELLVRETLAVEPSAAEREAVWRSVAERLGERTPAAVRRPRRLGVPRLAAVGLAALAVTLAIVTLQADKRGVLPAASEAEAAAILNATATSAGSALPAVGPGEYLFVRTSLTVPGAGAVRVDSKSWTATDGSGLIVDRERSTDPNAGRSSETSTTKHRAGSDTARRTEDGVTRRYAPQLFGTWRAVVPGDDVVRLPARRDALLDRLRQQAGRAVRRNPYPLVERQIELSGRDLIVVDTATELLVEAPLSPRQRAALLSLLADAPDWYRPGGSAEPIRIRDLGPTRDALGRKGTAVRIATELTDRESAGAGDWTVDLVLDPNAGRLLETRSYEHGRHAEPVRRTVEAQRVVGRDAVSW